MSRLSIGLWIALAGAVLQFTALGSDFYSWEDNIKDAWFGVPHVSALLLASALTSVSLTGLSAANRQPVRGRWVGGAIAAVGLIALLHTGYRMLVPPFKGCLTYNCGFSPNVDATILPGMWIGFVGTIGAVVGGIIHAASATAARTPPRPWIADRQIGMTPWLGLAALGAVGQFVFGYTIFNFYTANFSGDGGSRSWSGWLATPHTGSLVLLMSVAVLFLVVSAARGRAPVSPSAAGALIGLFGFIAISRIAYRIIAPPFHSSAVAGTFEESADIHIWAWLSLASAVVVIVAGIAHAMTTREPTTTSRTTTSRAATEQA
ncbi:MAG: hypothetical protein M3N57_07900 [Actinomycetota bacterium]|nr:hypothetical protein [Actinomycetota bacterium]